MMSNAEVTIENFAKRKTKYKKGKFKKPDSIPDSWPSITRVQTQAEKDLIEELTDNDPNKKDAYKKTIGQVIWAATERQRYRFGVTDRVSAEQCEHMAGSMVGFAVGVLSLHGGEDSTKRKEVFVDAIQYAEMAEDVTTLMAVESLCSAVEDRIASQTVD